VRSFHGSSRTVSSQVGSSPTSGDCSAVRSSLSTRQRGLATWSGRSAASTRARSRPARCRRRCSARAAPADRASCWRSRNSRCWGSMPSGPLRWSRQRPSTARCTPPSYATPAGRRTTSASRHSFWELSRYGRIAGLGRTPPGILRPVHRVDHHGHAAALEDGRHQLLYSRASSPDRFVATLVQHGVARPTARRPAPVLSRSPMPTRADASDGRRPLWAPPAAADLLDLTGVRPARTFPSMSSSGRTGRFKVSLTLSHPLRRLSLTGSTKRPGRRFPLGPPFAHSEGLPGKELVA
jgi:hypothetical protein